MEGWVDNTHEDAFTHTVRLADEDWAVEVSAACLPSPTYEVREARAAVLSGPLDGGQVADFSRLAGTRMVAGFTRRLAELCGPRPGAGLLVEAGRGGQGEQNQSEGDEGAQRTHQDPGRLTKRDREEKCEAAPASFRAA